MSVTFYPLKRPRKFPDFWPHDDVIIRKRIVTSETFFLFLFWLSRPKLSTDVAGKKSSYAQSCEESENEH